MGLARSTQTIDALRNMGTSEARRLHYLLDPVLAPLRVRLIERATTHVTPAASVPVVCLMVYRARNAARAQQLISQVGPGADVRLWALDEVVPDLAVATLGCGPGGRFDHLNWLYEARPVADGAWVVVADDDVVFVRGDIPETIATMKLAGFNLAQPGQTLIGYWTQLFNLGRPFVKASDTNLVEIGPIFVADAAISREILPFPGNSGMGWGVEADWYQAKAKGFRIGIVDSCRMMHLSRGGAYLIGPEMEHLSERLASAGLHSIWQLRSRNRRWWKWQARPPWDESGENIATTS